MGMTIPWPAQNLLIQTNINVSFEQVLNQSMYHLIFIWIMLFNFRVQVGSGELLKFQAHYGSLLKASMTTLRKRDKQQENSVQRLQNGRRWQNLSSWTVLNEGRGEERISARSRHHWSKRNRRRSSGKRGGEQEERNYCCIGVTLQSCLFEPVLITAFCGGQVHKHDFCHTYHYPGSAKSNLDRVYPSNAPLQGRGQDIQFITPLYYTKPLE